MERKEGMNIMVIGAAGGIGKSLSLLLATSGFVKKLVLCDLAPTRGIEAELNQISDICEVKSQNESNCDADIELVLMPCGKPQNNPNEKRDDLLKANAAIFSNLVTKVSQRQKALPTFVIIGNPVNSLVVICAEALKKIGKYDPNRLIGFNELDHLRSKSMMAKLTGLRAQDVLVPILGGHSEKTIYPVLTNCTNAITGEQITLSDDARKKCFDDIRFAGDRVLEAYDNKGTAILSTAYAAFMVAQAMYIEDPHVHYAFIDHRLGKELGIPEYMTVGVTYNRSGISKVHNPSKLLTQIDDKDELFKEINSNIQSALKFA
ncbi:MAG: hypothetical protein MHMPM18_000456 [Marteilia pararefringens]